MALVESWDGLRLGLMAFGYQRVIWTHLHCVTCGVFKLGVSEELEEYPCPSCGAACKVVIIARGFTRHELPQPERFSKPLSARTRLELLAEPKIEKPRHISNLTRGQKLGGGYQSISRGRFASQGQHRKKLGYARPLKWPEVYPLKSRQESRGSVADYLRYTP